MGTTEGPRLVTAEQLLHEPERGCRYELLRGIVVRREFFGTKVALTISSITARLGAFADQHVLGVCGSSRMGFLLTHDPDTVLAPAGHFISSARIPASGVPGDYWPGAPDLAVEVVSPSDRFADVLTKVQEYLAAGTRLVWVLDPEARKAIVFRPGKPPETAGSDGELSGEDVLLGFVLRLSEVWV